MNPVAQPFEVLPDLSASLCLGYLVWEGSHLAVLRALRSQDYDLASSEGFGPVVSGLWLPIIIVNPVPVSLAPS